MGLITVTFYNVENFYSKNIQEDFLNNIQKWKEERYEAKLNKIAFCISNIGKLETHQLPSIIGLAEVENEEVLVDLVQHKFLKEGNYKTLIYQSLDERKINVGLLYRKDHFEVTNSYPIRIVFKDYNGLESYTRDVLYVEGKLFGELIHLFVVHLPSKIDDKMNQIKRNHIFKVLRQKIDILLNKNSSTKIILMGDFNDIPTSEELRKELNTKSEKSEIKKDELFNATEQLQSYTRGSISFKKKWMLFDQQLFSKGVVEESSNLKLIKTEIFDADFLKGTLRESGSLPFRTFIGRKYFGGYSDHFPIYTILKY